MSIENDIKGTPLEELKKKSDALRQFKDTEGYKVLLELIRGQEAYLLRMFMSDSDVDEKQLRADCRAWHGVTTIIDNKIEEYDEWLRKTIQMQRQQEEQMKGYKHG